YRGEYSFEQFQWKSAPHSTCRWRIVESAVTAIALLIIGNTFKQVHAAEFGPQSRRHINFGVSQLPEKEVAQPHLAAGTDHEIRVGQMAGVEMPRNRFLVDFQVLYAAIVGRRLQ